MSDFLKEIEFYSSNYDLDVYVDTTYKFDTRNYDNSDIT